MQLELERTEQARKLQQHLLQTIIDYCPVIIYLKNLKGEVVLTNSRMKNLAGLSSGTESPISPKMNNREEKNRLYEEYDKKVIEEKEMVAFEDEFIHRNGKITNYYLMKFPIFDKDGNIEYICNFSTDVTSLKKSERLMLEAKKEAEQAKEAQEVFMANMSHEIRTPMNGILGMSNLLMNSELNGEQQEFMEAIQESAKNLLAIINDLLDFSKIKSGKFHLESIEFKPRQAIKKAMYPLLFRANEKKVPLKCFIDTSVPENIIGDPLRLQQIIINLVGNAVKFTDTGYVEVKVYMVSRIENKALLNIDVVDTGIGIPQDKLSNIFESYTQTDTNISRIYGGTGLGLAIVKQLTELQNGNVSVKSELGKGSVFTVQIPYTIAETASDTHPGALDKREQDNMLKNVRVLVAEDNIINQKVVQKTLMKQNAHVEVVGNGQLAIEKLLIGNFDIVLMDLQMPEMDGYTATKHIRQVMKRNIPIVAMTADAISGESDKCIEVGMNGYISKPFDADDLYNKIIELTGKS
jgi:PAS domain S-box-containing protein